MVSFPSPTPPPILEVLGTGLDELNSAAKEMKQVSVAPDGSWVILFDSNGYRHSELP